MKNKIKKAISLVFVLTLALLILTGCTLIGTTKYNLSVKEGEMSLSDIAEKALPSCVLIDVNNVNTAFRCVGLAISSRHILVSRQAIPITANYNFWVKQYGGEDEYVADLNYQLEMSKYDLGFSVLTIRNNSVLLTPVEFSNSDLLEVGNVLMGIDVLPSAQSIEGDGQYRVFEAMTSALTMRDMVVDKPVSFREKMRENSFTINGNLLKSRPTYEHKFAGMVSSHFELCSAFLFDSKGKLVGLNSCRLVGKNDVNDDVVFGIGYATKANAIKKLLEDSGIL